MVIARTVFKTDVWQFKLELVRGKTKRIVDAKYKNTKGIGNF